MAAASRKGKEEEIVPRKGWIKLYYSILENPMWESEKPFTEAQAWVDLLLLAAYEQHEVNGETWEPGTVHLSKAALMERWGWSRYKFESVTKRWREQNMIEQPAFQRVKHLASDRRITIVKWDFFQGSKGKNQLAFQRGFQQQHKNIYKNSAECGVKNPRPRARKKPPVGGGVEIVRNEQGEWVARQK